MMQQPILFRTEFQGFSVEFSPFEPTKLACGTSQYFGVAGNGKQYVLQVDPGQSVIRVLRQFYTQDGVYDCCWSERNPNQLVSSCGDGSIKLWDTTTRDDFPINMFNEHSKEASSVHWNQVSKEFFISGSWDGTVKLWNPSVSRSLRTFAGHGSCVYGTAWSPHHASMLASVSGDKTLKVWDIKAPAAVQTVAAHGHEVLSLDWCKYQQNQIVTASADKLLKVWDLRKTSMAISVLAGHNLAVRRIKCSPHDQFIVGSASYDMSARMWHIRQTHNPMLRRFDHHTEFVCGIDFNLFLPGQMATCAWDRTLSVWNYKGLAPIRAPPQPMMRPSAGAGMPRISGAMQMKT